MSRHDESASEHLSQSFAKLAPKTETAIAALRDPDEMLTSLETAKLIGIKLNTLEIWRGQGKGPKFAKLGDGPRVPVRYRRADVAEWIEQRLYASTSHYTASLATLKPDLKRAGSAS